MVLLFPGAIVHPGPLQMRKKTKIDRSEILQNTSKKAGCNQGLKLVLKAIWEAGDKLFYFSKIQASFFVLVATAAVVLQQRCHMDPLDASVGTYHLCVTSALWLLGVMGSSCRLNQLLACPKLDPALFCGTNVCGVGNLAAASVSREIPCKPVDSCWEGKPGAEMHGQCVRSLDPVPVVHTIFCRLHRSFSIFLNCDISLIPSSLQRITWPKALSNECHQEGSI